MATQDFDDNWQPLSDAEMDELAILLHEFLTAETFYGKQRLVEGNDLLLRTEADSSLAGLILQYAENEPIRESLTFHRNLLKRSRQIGIREAFFEMRQSIGAADDADEADDPAPLVTREEAEVLVDVIGEFVTAENWSSAQEWLRAHPELLTLQADAVMEQLIRTHTQREETQVVRALIIHRDLLRACREIGVEAAFDRMINPPDAVEVIANNTIAVLTDRDDERANWHETVQRSRVRAAELGDGPMLDFLRAIDRLLSGEAPSDILPALDGDYQYAWARIVEAMGSPAE